MKNIVIYVHGKGGAAEEAGHYKPLFPQSEVIGFDYHAQTPWEAKAEFPQFFAQQQKRCDRLELIANSIGAFFSMSSLDESLVEARRLQPARCMRRWRQAWSSVPGKPCSPNLQSIILSVNWPTARPSPWTEQRN